MASASAGESGCDNEGPQRALSIGSGRWILPVGGYGVPCGKVVGDMMDVVTLGRVLARCRS
jgi:hypothetical protein